jgi:hypothetical protein
VDNRRCAAGRAQSRIGVLFCVKSIPGIFNLTITDDDIRQARRRARRESKVAYVQKRLATKGSWVATSGIATQLDLAQTANRYRAILKALQGRRFDDDKGRSRVLFLSLDPRAPVRVTPELVENVVTIYGDKIDDNDPNGERDPKNSPIVRSFLSKLWIKQEAYRQWDTGAATQRLKWEFDDTYGRFNRDDEIIVPEWLLKARNGLRGLDGKAWGRTVKMIQLLDMGWATSFLDAAEFIEESEPLGGGYSKDADITRLRKLCSGLLKKRETGSV